MGDSLAIQQFTRRFTFMTIQTIQQALKLE